MGPSAPLALIPLAVQVSTTTVATLPSAVALLVLLSSIKIALSPALSQVPPAVLLELARTSFLVSMPLV
jgi:uncharacterized membrane protein YGL010W